MRKFSLFFLFFHILIFVCLIINQKAFSQGDKFKKYDYKWTNENPSPIPVDKKYINEDAVILQEENMVWLIQSLYSKHILIKYLNKKGIEKYSKFVFPGSFDPLADKFDLEYSKRDSVLRPKGQFNSIRYFAARIIKPDGRVIKAEYDFKTQSEIIRYNQIDHTFYSWIFNVKEIEAGDEVEIECAYENIYTYKPSNRFYFNGELTKQNCSLKIRYPEGNLFFFQSHNGALLIDSAVNKETTPNTYEYIWTMKDIRGCIKEKGARLYKELPYVTYYQHHRDYNDKGMEVTYDAIQLPYPWEFAYRNMIATYPQHPDYYLHKLDKNTRALNLYFKTLTEKLKDTSAYTKFFALHQDIAENFSYQNDAAYFEGDDSRLERLAEFLEIKTLRAQSRYHLYTQLFFRLASPYFQVNLYDKRYEEMDFNCFYPMIVAQRFFCLPFKESFLYFYPKCGRFGYDCNELPFYYEDINAMLIPQTVPEEEMYKNRHQINYVKLKTPFSAYNDNTRNTISMVTISIDSMKTVFDTRLILNGQFSTITRGFYQYGSVDTSININYYKPVYLLSGNAKLISKEMTSHIKTYPFTTNFKLKYSCDDLINRSEDKTIKFSLKNFFNNITEIIDTTLKRYLSYYPDFQFTDQHKYILKFDKPIEIKDPTSFNFSIKNSFGDYSCSLARQQDAEWALETIFEVKNEKVDPANFHDVIEIYLAIQKLNDSFLILTY